MAEQRTEKPDAVDASDDTEEELPPLTEMVAEQLGGVRGLIESGIPLGVFVIINVIWDNALYWAIGFSVGVAVAIAVLRLARKESIRNAVNGLFGVVIGAFIAWKTGRVGNYYIMGIIQGLAYGVVLLGSVFIRHPLVGWLWSLIGGGGKKDWRDDEQLVRVFGWLTMLWGVVFLAKNLLRGWMWWHGGMDNILGVVTLVGGYPITALLTLVTIWGVRRVRPAMVLRTNTD
ncbi:MAG TPA: DUF3159 domain-containing protein [Stackebrandtia sp.]|uniref:DUF3159 domain-containing protein n=1 Tax=Stackebrandtia sp. TaxID=2023065 RepID=UPI002D64BFEE|nr:DUF3159 domain-containing protein [Stackebrandtia sp.]HZE41849.1 DUF3159 domain-containing protein [Stackebrandtia sp.]